MTANPAPWPQTEAALRGIFDRRWYTNHGPAAQALERRLAALLAVPDIVAAANPAIALLMTLEALALPGDVMLPALAPRRCLQAIRMAGLRPVICDVDPVTGYMTPATVRAALTPATAAILAVYPCDTAGLSTFGLPVVVDAGGMLLAPAGPAAAWLYAFDAGAIVDGAGGACLATHDAGLAARLRNIRSSYGAGPAVPVVRTANGRLSEAQAVFAGLGLDNLVANHAHAQTLLAAYADGLAGVPGVVLLPGEPARCSVAAGGFGCGRDVLLAVLHAEGFAANAIPPPPPGSPDAARFAADTVRLPMGNTVTLAAARRLCAVVRATRPGG